MTRIKSGRRSKRYDPLTAAAAADNNHKNTILNKKDTLKLLGQLDDPNEKPRTEAISAIASMLSSDAANGPILFKLHIVPLLLKRLTDNSHAVIALASGVLESLTSNEDIGEKALDAIMKHDGLLVLKKVLASTSILCCSDTPGSNPSYTKIAVHNILSIYNEMCDSSDSLCVRVIDSDTDLLGTCKKVLHGIGSKQTDPHSVEVVIARLLVTLITTDSNTAAAICHDEPFLRFLETHTTDLAFDAIKYVILLALLVHPASGTLMKDPFTTTRKMSDLFVLYMQAASAWDWSTSPAQFSILELVLQNLALLSCSQKGEEDQEDSTMLDVNGESLEPKELEAHIQMLFQAVMSSLIPLALPESSFESEVYPPERLACHNLAMDILHNVMWSKVDSRDQTDIPLAQEAWTQTCSRLSSITTLDEELTNSAYSLLYAVAMCLRGTIQCSKDEILGHIKLYQTSLNAELQLKIVGLLGCLASTSSQLIVNRTIGTFLMTVICSLPRSDPECVIEACNAVFEIYADSDGEYEQAVFRSGNFLQHLQKALPKLQHMAPSMNKHRDSVLADRAQDVIDNMQAFIEYKINEV